MTKKNTTPNHDLDEGLDRYDLPPDFDPYVPSREDILNCLRDQSKAISLEQLAQQLHIAYPLSLGAEKRVMAMVRDEQLLLDAKQRVKLNQTTRFISGRVQGHRDGFGFLIRDDKQGPDLFLSPNEMTRVLHGDRVLVRHNGEYRGKPEASIVEVLERSTNRLVGRLHREHGIFTVAPEDQRIKHDIFIAPADIAQARPGQVVTVEITRQPARHVQPQGRIIEVLGEIDDPGMEIEIAVRKFDVPLDFSDATLKQAAKIPQQVKPADFQGRIDLRDLAFITIDGEDARDFDDAVYCEEINIGRGKTYRKGWRLLVAIADVSHYVKPKEPLDEDAFERGTSVYFPRRVIPMLPEALSNGICSLNPGADRLALVCDMVVAGEGARTGKVTAYQFYSAVIHSHARTTYTQIWDALQQPSGPAAQQLAELYPMVQSSYELFTVLHAQRKERGAIDFDTVETKIVCNDLGRIERIEPLVRNDAHKLIEEFMLAANTCAADFMTRHKRLGLYRVHEGPTVEKLQAFKEYLRTLGLQLGGGDEPTTADFAQVIEQAKGRTDFEIIQTMCLRSLQQAIYSPDNSGHFGLAYPLYTHFTSPIRRYPDLLTHRVIKSILKSKRYVPDLPPEEGDELLTRNQREQSLWERLGIVLSARERRADEASYDVQAWLKCYFMKDHVGEVYSGKITGVAPFGIFITLDALYVEGMVHISELGSDYFNFNEATHDLRGERTGIRYKLTDAVQVQVARVNLETRKIDFRLVEGTGFKTLTKSKDEERPGRNHKKAASAKPKDLKGTASERRAAARKAARKAAIDERAATRKAKKRSRR
ncbi:ribonuclease R [Paenalcaligenes hominis]|uniref:Ribonuclease R n=1 Tax=Paenalcaligenes hominis TaxID=643674 RepID=A0ABX0WST4_9BURK|nr:ribonuclease R [Paenalcaligenes hominis]NJB65836.1 ribonuclease R [Paenalcaligenes hominis]GGE70110.1 ribonuclease R [Paenalcaligenes hominis]